MINEKQILSTALTNKSVMDKISELDPVIFQDSLNMAIFEIMVDMNSEDDPVNFSTLSLELDSRNPTLKSRFTEIIQENVIYQGELNHVLFQMKRNHEENIIRAGAVDLIKKNISVDEFTETILNREEVESDELIDFSTYSEKPLDDIFEAGLYIDYPLQQLNKTLGGMPRGDTVVVAGAPGSGKTTLCFQFAWAMETLFFQMEMPEEQMYAKYLSNEGSVSAKKILKKELTHDEMIRINKAHEESSKLKVTYSGEDNISKMCSIMKSMVKKKKIKIIIVDNFKLVSGGKGANREEQYSDVSRRFKKMAKKLKVPIIIIHHLTKDILKEGTKPTLGHLFGTGSLGQDASDVLMIWEEVSKEPYVLKNGDYLRKKIITVPKCRLGDIGDIDGIYLNGKYSRFEENIDNGVNFPDFD